MQYGLPLENGYAKPNISELVSPAKIKGQTSFPKSGVTLPCLLVAADVADPDHELTFVDRQGQVAAVELLACPCPSAMMRIIVLTIK
jgi:hypothetical protein